MPRYAQEKQAQSVTIYDNKAQQDVEFFYREPTTKEREAYDSESVKRKGKKVKFGYFSARLKYGLMLIAGVSDGYLDRGTRGNPKPISSNPDSADYDPAWKTVLKEVAPEIVVLFGSYVFDARGEIADDEEDDPAGDDGDKEPDRDDAEKNLPKISGF